MKNFKKTFRWLKYTLSILLLALVCVGTVELVVCSYQSPELYQRITAPVRAGLQQAAEFNQYIWSRLSTAVTIVADNAAVHLQNSWEELMTRLEPEPEPAEDIQLVDSEEVAPPPPSNCQLLHHNPHLPEQPGVPHRRSPGAVLLQSDR